MRPDYLKYVELSGMSAHANGRLIIEREVWSIVFCFCVLNMLCEPPGKNDMGEMWRALYETDDFDGQLQRILNQTKPFYDNLHAYTRMKLRDKYFSAQIDKNKPPIPASILGIMPVNKSIHHVLFDHQ